MMLTLEAWVRALHEHGPESRVTRHCEYAYGTGIDLVNYDGLCAEAVAGRLLEPPALPVSGPHAVGAVIAKIVKTLGWQAVDRSGEDA